MRKKVKYRIKKSCSGLTLIELLIGTFLILIVFLGIFGAYQLGMKVVGLTERKVTATAIANELIEQIRNLPYESVGTKGASLPFAQGTLDSTTSTVRNSIEYQIETQIKYIIDEADGTGAQDSCDWDYKRTEIKVSWSGRFTGEVKLTTDIAPKDKIQEIQTCQAQPGGILSVSVFNAYGQMVASPLIEVFDPITEERIDFASPVSGKHDFPLATSTYKVIVSKGENYTTDRTYGVDEIATPENPHPIIIAGQVTPLSLSIDLVSSFSIDTLSFWGSDLFSDSFLNESKILEKSNLVVSQGKVTLATTSEGYYSSGYLISTNISPSNLVNWDKFSFSDSELANTDLKYQIYFASGSDWYLIPDDDLPGNSTGFDTSPIDLSVLTTTTYLNLEIKGNFSTDSTSTTPILYDWQVSWITNIPTQIPNAPFSLRGTKIIGTDADENPVYKFSITTASDANGHKNLAKLEWDSYNFSVDPSTGLDLVETDPYPQPIGLVPNTTLSVKLYLEAESSYLLTLQDAITLAPIFSATVRMYNSGLGYDKIQYTNDAGKTYFIPLQQSVNYNLEITAPGYSSTSTTVFISGDVTETIKLEQIE